MDVGVHGSNKFRKDITLGDLILISTRWFLVGIVVGIILSGFVTRYLPILFSSKGSL